MLDYFCRNEQTSGINTIISKIEVSMAITENKKRRCFNHQNIQLIFFFKFHIITGVHNHVFFVEKNYEG